jgi:hypothetical protein
VIRTLPCRGWVRWPTTRGSTASATPSLRRMPPFPHQNQHDVSRSTGAGNPRRPGERRRRSKTGAETLGSRLGIGSSRVWPPAASAATATPTSREVGGGGWMGVGDLDFWRRREVVAIRFDDDLFLRRISHRFLFKVVEWRAVW